MNGIDGLPTDVLRQGDSEPTVSIVTPRGRAAVAVVAVRCQPELLDAEPRLFRAANGRALGAQALNRVCFGRWRSEPGEDVVVCRVAADVTEVSCHGGIAAAGRIVRDLEQRGCRVTTWQESLRGEHSLIATECLEALSQAATFRTAAILLEQSSGLLECAVGELLELPSDGFVRQLDDLLRWAEFGRHLTRPWRVVLAGVPNVGKSSLINRLLGYARSIVFAEPGTTRDVVTAPTVFDGWPVELADTAGMREAEGVIEAAGIERARNELLAADLAVIVLDRSRAMIRAERQLIAEFPRALLVANKSDLAVAWTDDVPMDAMAVSSLTGDGVERLISGIVARLVPSVPPGGTAIPVSEHQVACLEAARAAIASGALDEAQRELRRCLRGGTPC